MKENDAINDSEIFWELEKFPQSSYMTDLMKFPSTKKFACQTINS